MMMEDRRPMTLEDIRLVTSRGVKILYFAYSAAGMVKIGLTTRVEARLKVIQANSPVAVGIVAARVGSSQLERSYHSVFARYWSHGEWFHGSEPLLNEIDQWRLAEPITCGIGIRTNQYQHSTDRGRAPGVVAA